MSGRIATIELQFPGRYLMLFADRAMRPASRLVAPIVGDAAEGTSFVDVDVVAPIGVSLAATRRPRRVRLHQRSIPFANSRILILPLTEIAGLSPVRKRGHRDGRWDSDQVAAPRKNDVTGNFGHCQTSPECRAKSTDQADSPAAKAFSQRAGRGALCSAVGTGGRPRAPAIVNPVPVLTARTTTPPHRFVSRCRSKHFADFERPKARSPRN